jgi:uncharacterized protein YbjQ (UPF0145 family)
VIARHSVATFDEIHGYAIVRTLGYVSGIASRPRSRLRSAFRSLGMLVGLSAAELVDDVEALREEALESVRKRAEALGANAVIGLQFNAIEDADGEAKIVAFGRAVVLSPDLGMP